MVPCADYSPSSFACSLSAAAAPDAEQSAVAILTPAPQRQASAQLEAAGAVAERFLAAWQRADFAAMHDLLTFRNRELTSFADFEALYANAHGVMSLDSLDYHPRTLAAAGRVLSFHYDMTFKSRIVGKFADDDRALQLVMDAQADDWRIAWSPAAIFAEMGEGARLVFEEQAPSRAQHL